MTGPSVVRDRAVVRVRHALHFRLVRVADVARVTPHLVRVTLGGPQLCDFASPGFDDHVKVFIPPPGAAFDALPVLGPDGPVFLWGATRPVAMRDYTPHGYDASACTLQLDFALHDAPGGAGPATAWARRARRGDTLIVGGPRGSALVGTGFDWHLLAGDDTALPAIRRRLAELPAGARAVVCVEVDGPDDATPVESRAAVEVHWAYRTRAGGTPPSRLRDAVAAAALPAGDGYAWVGAESSEARAVRAALLERGVDRAAIRASGYWRRGAAASHDVHDDDTPNGAPGRAPGAGPA